MHLQAYLSDYGNALVAGAAALIVFAWLWARLGWVTGLIFLICFLGVIGSLVGLKFIAYGLRPPVDDTGLFALSNGAPSGHTAFATITYGGLAVVLAVLDRRPIAWLVAAVCVAVIATVAITRVTLNMHTAGDVIAGFVVGSVGVGVFARAFRAQVQDRRMGALSLFATAGAATTLLVVLGVRFNTLAWF